jgi:hypothetical protein
MCAERVMRHELSGDLFRKRRIKASTDIDRRQFFVLARIVRLEFLVFTLDVCLFGICLRVDGHILAGSHRHGSGD